MEIVRTQHAIDINHVESVLREDHYKLQNDFEAEWREERIKLESGCCEERTHRLRLESEYRDERSERFRIEAELRSSKQKIELSEMSDKDNLRLI